MRDILMICIAALVFSFGVGIGGYVGEKNVRADISADCVMTGSFRIANDAYKCVKMTRASDEPKH